MAGTAVGQNGSGAQVFGSEAAGGHGRDGVGSERCGGEPRDGLGARIDLQRVGRGGQMTVTGMELATGAVLALEHRRQP